MFGCAVLGSGCGKSSWFWLASRSNSRCDSVVKFCVWIMNSVDSLSRRVSQVVLYLSVPSVLRSVGVLIW